MKRYPFNMEKHAHDIMFRRNRAKNELADNEERMTSSQIEKYEKLIDDLGHLLEYRGIAYLTGKEWGLANESVHWAECMRG